MKVSTQDVRKIPCGCTITFVCDSPRGVNNAKQTISYCKNTYGEEDGKTYTAKTNRAKREIRITAIAVKQPKRSKK